MDVIAWVERFFPTSRSVLSREAFVSLVSEVTTAARDELGVTDAVKMAAGYEFPSELIQSNASCLRSAQLDFTTMVQRRLKTLSPNRLNVDRARLLRDDNPAKTLILDLAWG